MLHGNDAFRFVNVEDFGFVRSYSPRLTAGDVQIMVPVSYFISFILINLWYFFLYPHQ